MPAKLQGQSFSLPKVVSLTFGEKGREINIFLFHRAAFGEFLPLWDRAGLHTAF